MQHSKIISGIDIGSSKVTTIVAQYMESEDRTNVVAVSSVPILGFRKGQIVNLEQAVQSITQSLEAAERMAGFQIDTASVAIAATLIESVNAKGVIAINNPGAEITSEDVKRVIDTAKTVSIPAGKELLHLSVRKYRVDGQDGITDPVGMNGSKLEVEINLVLIPTVSIKNFQKCISEVGIKTEHLVFNGIAAAKAALSETEKELGVALVDIGGNTTSITIMVEGNPVFASVLPVGGNNVTNDLAIGLRFTLEEAERIKLKLNKVVENKKFENEVDLGFFEIVGEPGRKLSIQTAVTGIIRPRLEEIFTMVWEEINKSGYANMIPAGIVLTGGGSLTVNAREICTELIRSPLRMATPPKLGGIVEEILNPAYTSSIGLLLYSLTETGNIKSQVKNKVSISGLFGKIKNFLEPLLP